jgi:hypothetical protein
MMLGLGGATGAGAAAINKAASGSANESFMCMVLREYLVWPGARCPVIRSLTD